MAVPNNRGKQAQGNEDRKNSKSQIKFTRGPQQGQKHSDQYPLDEIVVRSL